MVRYPLDERRSIADLENMRIRTPAGDEVPFGSVAEVSFGEAYSSITRQNRRRTVSVSADIDEEEVEPGEIIEEISEDYVPGLLSRNPGSSTASKVRVSKRWSLCITSRWRQLLHSF
jgi:multidrug efflux pump subunit AcrB